MEYSYFSDQSSEAGSFFRGAPDNPLALGQRWLKNAAADDAPAPSETQRGNSRTQSATRLSIVPQVGGLQSLRRHTEVGAEMDLFASQVKEFISDLDVVDVEGSIFLPEHSCFPAALPACPLLPQLTPRAIDYKSDPNRPPPPPPPPAPVSLKNTARHCRFGYLRGGG